MNTAKLIRRGKYEWEIPAQGAMRVPAVIFAGQALVRDMEDKVFEQAANVATLPGIVKASYAMPDAHWGYGFPIGGVAAFDPDEGGVISAGGVGFDVSCGVRTLLTGVAADDILACQARLADALLAHVPAGVGSTGAITLSPDEMAAPPASIASISAGDSVIAPVLPSPAGTWASSASASRAWQARMSSAVTPVSKVRTPQETSKPTPPAEITPPSSGSKAATPPIGKP